MDRTPYTNKVSSKENLWVCVYVYVDVREAQTFGSKHLNDVELGVQNCLRGAQPAKEYLLF